MNWLKRLRDLATSIASRAIGNEIGNTANTDRPTIALTVRGEKITGRRIQHYGLATRPPDGCEVFAVSLNGERSQTFALFCDNGNRPRIEKGDTCIFAGGNIIILRASGDIEITGNTVITGNLSVQGDITATGDIVAGTVSLKKHTHPQNNGNDLGGGTSTSAPNA